MCLLNGHYARYVHRRYGRRGHLFQAPFYSRLIEMDADLLETCTYVVNNPVRAGICRTAAQWKWSTYRATAGFDHPPPYLALDELLPLLGRTPAAARRAYREHVAFRQVPVPGTGSSS
jgi:hypothetical protein